MEHFEKTLDDYNQILVGAGRRVRRFGFADMSLYLVGLYVEPSITPAFEAYRGLSLFEIQRNEGFYQEFIHGTFIKSIVLVLIKDITASQLSNSIIEPLEARIPRDDKNLAQLTQHLLHFNAKVGDSITFTCVDAHNLILRLGGAIIEEIESTELTRAIFAMFLDRNAVSSQLKHDLIAEFPTIQKTDEEIIFDPSKLLIEASKEPLGKKTFEPKLTNGDILLGTSVLTTKDAFSDIIIQSVGFYIEPIAAIKCLAMYKGQSFGALAEDEKLYTDLIDGAFRKTFCCVFARDVTGNFLAQEYRLALSRCLVDKSSLPVFLQQLESIPKYHKDDTMQIQCSERTVCVKIGKKVMQTIDSIDLSEAFVRKFLGGGHSHDRKNMVRNIPFLLDAAALGIAHSIHDEIATLRESVGHLPVNRRVKRGFLYKFHPCRTGLILETWTQRYVCLSGVTLTYYKDKGDTAMKGKVELNRPCEIVVEGIKTGKQQLVFGKSGSFYTFRIIQKESGKVLRLSTKDADDGEEWVDLLRQVAKKSTTTDESQHPSKAPTKTEVSSLNEKRASSNDTLISFLSIMCLVQLLLLLWSS